MDISTMDDKTLKGCVKALEHAKSNRPGGLLTGEQKALDNMRAELELRADEDYRKATSR